MEDISCVFGEEEMKGIFYYNKKQHHFQLFLQICAKNAHIWASIALRVLLPPPMVVPLPPGWRQE